MITYLPFIGYLLAFIAGAAIYYLVKNRKSLVQDAKEEAAAIVNEASESSRKILNEAHQSSQQLVNEAQLTANNICAEADDKNVRLEERNERLKTADSEMVSRLKQARAEIEGISDKCVEYAADVEIISEDDLLSSQSYQEDRKNVKAELKKLAINAIDGVRGSASNVNITKFTAIAAKADMAGALLLTTVEMLCSKVTANNGHLSLEKLGGSIIATETLIKCIDSRATINEEFRLLLKRRLEIEINFKKARELAREKQRELREQEREEKKAQQEAEKARKAAEKEEEIKAKAISELKEKMAQQNESERASFQAELERLQAELDEAHERMERAKSRAQETKQGHVYLISNIGSFGESVLKIGMTRRMDPMDRVKELGDASVPFTFDVHALIESNDAPNLEATLHRVFDERRVNKVNRRKEYFNVSLDEIETELEKLNINALINKVASADEYYQSLKLSPNIA